MVVPANLIFNILVRMRMHFFKKIIFTAFIIEIFITLATVAHASKQDIVMLLGHQYPPFYSVDNTNKSSSLHGVFINFMNKFKKKYPEYNVIYKCLPRARIRKVLKHDQAEAFALTNPMFERAEINNRGTYSKTLWTMSDHLIILKNSPIKFRKLSDLKGKSIAVIHGNGYGPLDKYFENGTIQKVPVYKTKQQLKMLLKKRVDAVICSSLSLPWHLKCCKLDNKLFKFIKKPLYSYELKIFVMNTHKAFLHDLNKFISSHKLPSIKEIIKSNRENFGTKCNSLTCY